MQDEDLSRHERLINVMSYLMELYHEETYEEEVDLRKELSSAIHAVFEASQAAGRIDSPEIFINVGINYTPKSAAHITITIKRGGRPNRHHSYYGEGAGFGISKASVERMERYIEESDQEYRT